MRGLKRFLEEHELTQSELARAIGTSEPFVSQWLAGKSGASQETVAKTLAFCKRLDPTVSFEDLFDLPALSPAANEG